MTHHFIQKRRLEIVICLLLVMVSTLIYFQLNGFEFVTYDDELYITKNPYIKAGFTRESIVWAFTSGYAANWHPLTWLSHILDIELYGLNPMVAVIEGFRWALLPGADTLKWAYLPSVAMTAVLLVLGLYFFRRMERTIADVI